MSPSARACVVLALAFNLGACVENEEEITVRPDGSVSVVVAAKGSPADLADGYAVPLGAPWVAQNAETAEWIRVLGPDTGSATMRANLALLGSTGQSIRPDNDVRLAVSAQFASASAIPRTFALDSDPFRTAYLARETDLRIERKGGRAGSRRSSARIRSRAGMLAPRAP